MQEDKDIESAAHTRKAPKQARWHTRLWPACLGPGCLCCKIQKVSLTFIGYDPVGEFQTAASVGDVASVERFINFHQYHVNEYDRRGRTSLHYACAHNRPEVVALLLSKNAWINVQDDEGHTPLIKAIQFENVKCVSLLLKRGANPHMIDFSGDTALHHAVSRGNTTIVSKLLEYNVDIEAKTEDGLTPYDLALFQEKHLMAQFLIQKGAKAHSVVDSNTRRASLGKYSKSMTNLLLIDEGEDKITELASLSSDESSPKKPEQRKKKHVRFSKEVHYSTDPMPSCREIRPPRELKSILKMSDSISTAHGRIKQQSLVWLPEDKDVSLSTTKDKNSIFVIKERLKGLSRSNKNNIVKKTDQTVPRECETNPCSCGEPIPTSSQGKSCTMDELAEHNLALLEEKYQEPQHLRRASLGKYSQSMPNLIQINEGVDKITELTSLSREALQKRSESMAKVFQRNEGVDKITELTSLSREASEKLSESIANVFQINEGLNKITELTSLSSLSEDDDIPLPTTKVKNSISVIKERLKGLSHHKKKNSVKKADQRVYRKSETNTCSWGKPIPDELSAHNLVLFEKKYQIAPFLRKKEANVHSVVGSNSLSEDDDIPLPTTKEKNSISVIKDELSAHNLVLFEEKYQIAPFLRKKEANVLSVVESNSDESSPKKPEQRKKKRFRFSKEVPHSTDPMPSCSGVRPPRELKSIPKTSDSISTVHGRIKQQSLVWLSEDDDSPPSITLESPSISVIKATRCDNMECVSELLKQYVDPHMTDLCENTAAHHTVSRDNKTSLSKLLENNVDIDANEEDKLPAHNLALFEVKYQDAQFLRKNGANIHSVVESNRFSEKPDVPASITEDQDSTSVTKIEEKKSEGFLQEPYDRDISVVQPTVFMETKNSECVGNRGDSVEASEKNDCGCDTMPELTPSSGDTVDPYVDVDPTVVPTNPNDQGSCTRNIFTAVFSPVAEIGIFLILCIAFFIIFMIIMMKRIHRRLWGENHPRAPRNQEDEHVAAQAEG